MHKLDVQRVITVISGHLWIPVFLYIVLLPTSTLYNVPLLFLALLGMLSVW